jgi:hypothetical protein
MKASELTKGWKALALPCLTECRGPLHTCSWDVPMPLVTGREQLHVDCLVWHGQVGPQLGWCCCVATYSWDRGSRREHRRHTAGSTTPLYGTTHSHGS